MLVLGVRCGRWIVGTVEDAMVDDIAHSSRRAAAVYHRRRRRCRRQKVGFML